MCDRCGCNHQEPMGLQLNLDLVDESTARKIRVNLQAAGVEHLYFPPRAYRTPWGTTRQNFIELSYVNYFIQGRS